jgi:hypothetical protein
MEYGHDPYPDERGDDPRDLQGELERVVDHPLAERCRARRVRLRRCDCVPLAGRKSTPTTAVHIAIM